MSDTGADIQTGAGAPITILVCGGRTYSNYTQLKAALDHLRETHTVELIVHGGAYGADSLGGRYAREMDIPCDVYSPSRKLDGPGRDWKFRRNLRMLHTSEPDMVIAFTGGPGTGHMVKHSLNAGYPVWDLRGLRHPHLNLIPELGRDPVSV